MQLRMHLLKGANGLLYLGPLVAGMSGFGWGMVASFTAIFVVWLIVLRPEQWPQGWRDWRSGMAILSALTIVLSQVALIAVLFALGRGIGAVAGFLPVLLPQVPLAISFMAIPLGRMLWNAGEAAERGLFLDDAARAANAPRAAAAAALAVVPLLALADDAPDAAVALAVGDTMASPTADLRLKALAAALARPEPSPERSPERSHATLRRALILWATEPEVVAPARVPEGMALAFAIADRNADLLRLYVPRALALIAAFPDRVADFPTPAALREMADRARDSASFRDLPDHIQADLRDGLHALARAIDHALAAAARTPAEAARDPAAAGAAQAA